MLYKLKYGVFSLNELNNWVVKFKKIEEPTDIDNNIAFAIKFLENIFKENLSQVNIDFNLEYDINITRQGSSSFLNFILKIKEFLELEEDFLPLITYFRTHLNMISYSWIKEMIFFKVCQYTDFLEQKQYYMQSLFSEFIDKDQDDYENLYYLIWAKYFNKFIKRNYIKFNTIEYLKTEFCINLIKNPDLLNQKDLEQCKLVNKQQIKISFRYYQIFEYIDYLLALIKIQQNEFDLNDFKNIKQNILIQKHLIKLTFYFSDNIEEDIKELQNDKKLPYILREEQNFQIYFYYVIQKMNFQEKINMLGHYFDYLQEHNWFLIIFGSLLIENQDFQNAFILFRRLYDNLKQQIQNQIYLPEDDNTNLKVDYSDEYMSDIFVSELKINELSKVYNKDYIFNNKNFHKQLIENVLLMNSLNYKLHFSLQVITEIKDQDFDIYTNDFECQEFNEILKQILSQFSSDELDTEDNLKRGLLIEQIYLYSLIQDTANYRNKIKSLMSQENVNLINLRLVKSIYNILDYYKNNFKNVLMKVQNLLKKSLEKFIEFLNNNQNNQQYASYIIVFIQILSLFDLKQIQNQMIEIYINLQLEKNQDKFNQLLLQDINDDTEINLDNKDNLIAICIRDINKIEWLDQKKLYYLFNLEKESILIWLILSKFFITKENYLLSYECLLKADYLMDNSQPDLYRDYFELQVIKIKDILGNQNDIKINPSINSKYVIRDEYCNSSLVKEESLQNSLMIYWTSQDYDKFLPLAEFYSMYLLHQNRLKELCDIIIQIPEYIFEKAEEITFDKISSLKTSNFTKNPLKILNRLIDYIMDNYKAPNEQQIELENIQRVCQTANNWRQFLLNFAKTSCLNITLKNQMQKTLMQLQPIQDVQTKKKSNEKQLYKIKDLKYTILKQPQKYNLLKNFIIKKFQINKNNNIKTDSLQENYNKGKQFQQQIKKNLQLEENFSGMKVWEQTGDLNKAINISLFNSIQLFQNQNLNDEQKEQLCVFIKEDIEINRYLVLPLLKFYYENEKDEELEELLIEISEKKVDAELEYMINFYKLKMKTMKKKKRKMKLKNYQIILKKKK